MRHLIKLIILIFSSNFLSGQVDDGVADHGSINWSDPIYADFFIISCPMIKSGTLTTVKNITKKWYQDSDPWGSWPYGDGINSCGTFASTGCYLTCYAMMLTDVGDWIDPWSLNTFIFKDNKFYNGVCGMNRGQPLDNRPTPKLKYGYEETLINYTRLKATLDKNGYVVAHVNGSGSCSHWILVYAYENIDGKDVFYTVDPTSSWDASKHDLSKYTVCGIRYFNLIEESKVKNIVVDGVTKNETTITKGKFVSFTWASPFPNQQRSTSTCEKKLWVIKNSSGGIEDSYPDNDLYTYPFTKSGTYYVSFAINNGSSFDGEVVKIIVEDSDDDGGGGGGSSICPTYPMNYIHEGFEINGVSQGDVIVCKNGPINFTGNGGGNIYLPYESDGSTRYYFESIIEGKDYTKNFDGQQEYTRWTYLGTMNLGEGFPNCTHGTTHGNIIRAAEILGITLKEGKFYRFKLATNYKSTDLVQGWKEYVRIFYILPSSGETITIQNAEIGPANYQINSAQPITINNSTINSNFKAENSSLTNGCPIIYKPF